MQKNTPMTPIGILRCDKCTKVMEVSDTDMPRYVEAGWPRCCDEVMTCFTLQGKPDDSPGVGRGQR